MGRDAGFTLVEALASLAVVALFSLMLTAGLGVGRDSWRRLDAAAASGELIGAAQDELRARIERAWPQTVFLYNPPGVDFEGRADQAVFLAPPAQADGPGALRRYRLSLQPGGAVILESVSDLAAVRQPQPERKVLLRGAEALDIAYFGPTNADLTPRWRPVWIQQARPPELVRVRIAFPAGDRRRWPELLIRPVADVDTACLVMVETGACRGR